MHIKLRLNEKRLFLFYGIINFFITNFVLHISLLILPTLISTSLSQFVNIFSGYYLYGKKVFKFNKLGNIVFRKYVLLAFILWILNYSFIQTLFQLGVNKNLTAIMIIPFLVAISYLTQKNYVFK
ncbi:hypothetical protein OA981_02910 [Prochlorococcus sp. AH-716-A09]|nr:hypothetical protein [Prochlorococcus sp. AH-716-A09]